MLLLYDPSTSVTSTLSLHDALPISKCDSYLNQSLTNVPSILSHFSSSNASRTGLEMSHILQQECRDRKSGSAGMPRPISYAVFGLKNKRFYIMHHRTHQDLILDVTN